MPVFFIYTGPSGAENDAAVRQFAVIAQQFLFADEVDSCIIVCKVIGHFFYFFFDSCCISSFFQHDEAFTRVLLAGRQLRCFSVPDCFKSTFYRNGILTGVFDTADTADRIGVSL